MTSLSTPTPGIVERLASVGWDSWEESATGCDPKDCHEAAALLKEMAGLLKCIEWGDEDNPGCPFCGTGKESGHLDRCQLASALSTYHGDKT